VLQNIMRTAAILVLMLVVLTACGGEPTPAPVVDQQPADPAGDAVQATQTPLPPPTEALAAVVNGEPITLAVFQSELERESARLAEVGVIPADQAAFETSVLNNLIDQRLIEQAAILQGLSVSEEEIDAEIALNIEIAGGEENWMAWLNANMFTPEAYRKSIYSVLLTGKIRDQVIASVPQSVEQTHARHILVSTEAEAQQLYDQLINGAEFAELAFQYSRDVSTRELGGDLGWFAREQLTEAVVADTAFALPIGEISQPVASRLGYHIIEVINRLPDRPLDDAARANLFELTFERWRQSLWDQATVQRYIGG
jgi:peptidyl-prolyl cis-trans isomerase C